MVLAMVVQAAKGAYQEVKAEETVPEKARKAHALTRIICRELLGLFSAVPYALFTASLWRNPEKQQQPWRFNLLKDIRYGPADRNLLDVYTPKTGDSKSSLPVMMFVHGGVWASGDKYLYSPIGATLAHHGIIALLVQYTLYPEVLAKDQVKEISRALSWALDNVSQYGGDPNQIHILGHSAGAHLAAMLFWERAWRNLTFRGGSSSEDLGDKRGPRSYIGLAGVYNIKQHYEYESGRGVASISCMKPAMNGPKGFAGMSPALLFGSLLTLKSNQQLQTTMDGENPNDLSKVDASNMDWGKWASKQPPFVLMASDNDITVPGVQSVNFHKVLQELDCNSELSLPGGIGHDDFACWVRGYRGEENPNAKVVINEVLEIANDEEKLDSVVHGQ